MSTTASSANHIAVHPIALRGLALKHLKANNIPYESFYWRSVKDGKAPISFDEACQLLHDYDKLDHFPEAPCVIVSSVSHGELLRVLSKQYEGGL